MKMTIPETRLTRQIRLDLWPCGAALLVGTWGVRLGYGWHWVGMKSRRGFYCERVRVE